MSTDLYGVRVLALPGGEQRVRLRVFTVYYDIFSGDDGQVERIEPLPPPDDASFFLRILWDEGDTRFGGGGPIGDAITVDQICDESWVDANTARFIARVHQLAVRNSPPRQQDWPRIRPFHYERGGRWDDEDLLVQADYDLLVSDRQWIGHLTEGQSWGTTSYTTEAEGFANMEDSTGLWSASASPGQALPHSRP